MTDIASIATPVASPLMTAPAVAPGAAVVPGAATAAAVATAEGAPDPFAALLASLAPTADTTATPQAPATPVPVAVAQPIVPGAKVPAPPVPPESQPILDYEGDQTGDAPADDGSADPEADKSDDPQLAMMLALAPPPPAPISPPLTTPAVPTQATVETLAPVAAQAAPNTRPTASDGKAAPATTAPGAEAEPASDEGTAARSTRFAGIAARLFGSTAATPAADTAQSPSIDTDADAKGAAIPATVPTPIDERLHAAIRAAMPRNLHAPAPATATTDSATVTTDRATDSVTAADPAAMLFGAPATAAPAQTQDAGTAAPAAPTTDAAVTRELSIAQDGQWLDTLARDIAATAGKDGALSFRLDPHHLGSLTVHINHSDEGASIRLSADTEAGRQMLQDAQPRLAAEARAQGLTLRETSVDLGGSNAGNQGQQGAAGAFANLAQGQSQRDPSRDQTFINLNPAEADETAPATEASARSDLYA